MCSTWSSGYSGRPQATRAQSPSGNPGPSAAPSDRRMKPPPTATDAGSRVSDHGQTSAGPFKAPAADQMNVESLVRKLVHAVLTDPQQALINGKMALNEKDAAALLSLNPWQLRDLRIAGKISHHRIVGDRVRYTPDDLRAYLERGRQPGSS